MGRKLRVPKGVPNPHKFFGPAAISLTALTVSLALAIGIFQERAAAPVQMAVAVAFLYAVALARSKSISLHGIRAFVIENLPRVITVVACLLIFELVLCIPFFGLVAAYKSFPTYLPLPFLSITLAVCVTTLFGGAISGAFGAAGVAAKDDPRRELGLMTMISVNVSAMAFQAIIGPWVLSPAEFIEGLLPTLVSIALTTMLSGIAFELGLAAICGAVRITPVLLDRVAGKPGRDAMVTYGLILLVFVLCSVITFAEIYYFAYPYCLVPGNLSTLAKVMLLGLDAMTGHVPEIAANSECKELFILPIAGVACAAWIARMIWKKLK